MSFKGCRSIPEGGIRSFQGLYDTGEDITVPPDHAVECINCVFDPRGFSSRSGISDTLTLAFSGARKIFQGTPGNLFFLILNKTGKIYINGSTLLLNVSGMTDFGALNMYERVYISPNAGNVPLAGESIMVWNGSNIRLAAGYAPVAASPMTSHTVNSGRVEKGIHKFAVAYETDSGFITPPGPKIASTFTPTSVDAPGERRIDLQAIPTGPSHISYRHLLATKSNEEEYFFVPDGKIWDNTTTVGFYDFYDNELVISADHLFDLREILPAGLGLAKYRGRMFIWGFSGDNIYVSHVGEPEAFSKVDGVLHVPTESDGNDVKAIVTLRDVLYLYKFTGIYATEDNDDAPSTWGVPRVEGGVGAYSNGIASIVASQAGLDTGDVIVFASKAGLFMFDGMIRRPELSWKIQKLWDTINPEYFHKVALTHDVWRKILYITAPIGNSTECNLFLLADYSGGWDSRQIKWSKWIFPFDVSHIAMSSSTQDGKYRLRIVNLSDNKLYDLDPDATKDISTDIPASYNLGPVGDWTATTFRGVQVEVKGTGGSLDVRLEGQGGSPYKVIPSHTLQASPKKDFIQQCNITSEQLFVKLSTTAGQFHISKVAVLGVERGRAQTK